MRKLALAAVLASTAMATPALARDDAWYIGVEAGPSLVEDQSFDLNGVNNNATADLAKGYDADAIIGYDFGGFRLEAEVGYKQASLTAWDSQLGTPAGPAATLARTGKYTNAGGKLSNLSFMLNGLLDFGEDDGLAGYVGGGLGVARTKAGYSIDPAGPDFLNDSDTGLAWQVIAGIRAPLSDNWDIGLKYRFFNQSNLELVDRIGRTADSRYRSHSLLGSLIYNFGEPAAPPPPPPPKATTVTRTAPAGFVQVPDVRKV